MKKAGPLLIAVNLATYFSLAYFSRSTQINRYYVDLLGLNREVLLGQGYYWQLITSIFLHFNLNHLAYNLLFMAVFAYMAEEIYPWPIVVTIYFFSGLSVSMAILLAYQNAVFAGSSGAILGLIGAVLASTNAKSLILLSIGVVIFFTSISNVYLAHFIGILTGYTTARYLIIPWIGELNQ